MIDQERFNQFVRDVRSNKIQKIVQISHNDLDGMGAVVVGKYYFGDKIVIHYNASYNGVNKLAWKVLLDKQEPIDALLITDISVNDAKLIEYIREDSRPVFLFDHHETAKLLNEFPWAQVSETSTCGTKLFYQYCVEAFPINFTNSGDLQSFVELVNAYDTWAWAERPTEKESVEAVDLSIFASTVGQKFFMDAMLEDDGFFIDEHNMSIVQTQRDKLQYVLIPSAKRNMRHLNLSIPDSNGILKSIDVGVVVMGGEQLSLVAEALKSESETLILVTSTYMSLRTSRDDIDMSVFAQQFGGGGHKQAAGCNVTKDNYYILEAYWKRLLEMS